MAVDMFLKLDGIEGDSTDNKHKGEFEIFSWSWGLNRPSSGGGVSVSDFSIVKEVSSASPELMKACCTGEHIRWASLTLASKQTQVPFVKIKLEDVLISGYSTGGSGPTSPADQLTLNFTRVEIQAADKKGNFGAPVQCDFKKHNTEIIGHDH